MIKVLLTGPESSGKSFLARELANHFNGELVIEAARDYLDDKPKYLESDLLEIAKLQKRNEKSKISDAKSTFVFCDTGIEVIKIWSQEKFGRVNPIINKLNKLNQYDLVLLCKPNIPWQDDPLRENPTDRLRLFELYKEEINREDSNYRVIDEELEKRLSQAINFVRALCR